MMISFENTGFASIGFGIAGLVMTPITYRISNILCAGSVVSGITGIVIKLKQNLL